MKNNIMASSSEIVKQVYMDVLSPSAQVVGRTLKDVLEFVAYPIYCVSDKYKENIKKHFENYAKKVEDIPEEKRCEVIPEIGVPIVQKLQYTTNENLADLFTTLLASASNKDTECFAHPSFVDMIGRMTPDEARIIKYMSKREKFIPYCECIGIWRFNGLSEDTYKVLEKYLTLIPKEITLDYPNQLNVYFANLISLGILVDKTPDYKPYVSEYSEIKDIFIKKKMSGVYEERWCRETDIRRSFLEVTDLGILFIKACVK